ncbi:MAG: hypothetical protein LBJ00_12465 [Planctomycetaceae bacterium]|nr:hypothetical protein [Planctomycetaceae bacterium]
MKRLLRGKAYRPTGYGIPLLISLVNCGRKCVPSNWRWCLGVAKLSITFTLFYSSCFEIPEAAINLQRKALNKCNGVERLFKGEAYRPYWLRFKLLSCRISECAQYDKYTVNN